jgi:hypothetical protein
MSNSLASNPEKHWAVNSHSLCLDAAAAAAAAAAATKHSSQGRIGWAMHKPTDYHTACAEQF